MQFRTFLGIAGVVLVAALTGACASTGATPYPFPMPGGRASSPPTPGSTPGTPAGGAVPPSLKPDTYAITGTALSLRGTPYRDGGADPSGFDCSGFTQFVFGQYGINLPRAVADQFRAGKPVKSDELAPGDLIFFTTSARGASHVAIALGGDEFIHAPSSTGVVRVERLSASYWSKRFVGARRMD